MSNSRTNVDILRNLLVSLGGSSTAQIDALLLLIGSTPTLHGAITLGTSAADTINQVGLSTGRAAATTYTPALTNSTNITSTTLRDAWYTRSNDLVQGVVMLNIAPTAASTTSLVKIALPVASNFTNTYDAGGIVISNLSVSTVGPVGYVNADTSGDLLNLQFRSDAGPTGAEWTVMFWYRIK